MILRRFTKKLALSCATLIALVGASEVAARLWLGADWKPGCVDRIPWPDVGLREPYRGWSMRPDLCGLVIGRHASYAIELDHDGYRQRVPDDVGADALRLLVIGDSISFGWGVAEEDRYSNLLQDRLAAELGRDVVMWNTGVPGYSIDQTLWTYQRHGARVKADVVVLCTVLNDVAVANAREYNGKGKPALVLEPGVGWRRVEAPVELVQYKPLPMALRLSRYSAAVTALRRMSEAPPEPMRIPTLLPWDEAGSRVIDKAARELGEQYMDESAPIHEALRRLAEAVKSDGAPLIVVSAPFSHHSYLVDPRVTPPPTGRAESPYSAAVMEACAALGLPAVSVDAEFGRAVDGGAILHVGDGHPNALGHDIIARSLFPLILDALRAK